MLLRRCVTRAAADIIVDFEAKSKAAEGGSRVEEGERGSREGRRKISARQESRDDEMIEHW